MPEDPGRKVKDDLVGDASALRPQYGDKRRRWHPTFVDYMYSIVAHPNYTEMPCTTDPLGKIDWTIPSNRKRGSKNWDGNARRRAWWKAKADSLGTPARGPWISRLARRIHPFGSKPCQTCGRVLQLDYVYPTRVTIQRLNLQLPAGKQLSWESFLTVYEIVDHFSTVIGEEGFTDRMASVFHGIEKHVATDSAKNFLESTFVSNRSRLLSPGAMSNAPDRLDGFHTYNLCCRHREDRGRKTENLRTYQDDRRAFEEWCEGDWAAANRLMKLTAKGACVVGRDCLSGNGNIVRLTADHLGPISLGFKHSPDFRPMCGPCNSARNRRMTYDDVRLLVVKEREIGSVASWQAEFLWNRCKLDVQTNDDAKRLSTLMRTSQHHYLHHLHEALIRGVPDVLLQFLDPSRAGEKVEFVNLDPTTLTYRAIRRTARNRTYARSKGARMVRIAFDALVEYAQRDHRNIQSVDQSLVSVASQRYSAALERAHGQPSSWRKDLLEILGEDLGPEDRTTRLESLFKGGYLPDKDYTFVRRALSELMDAYSEVLARRFANGDTVSWNDA
jgi:Alw26I/Eco31I/Esp3I family type II restriction endonuclease